MRIAVCFSGQVRTGVENYQNIREVLGELYDSCDFFIHTWNFCSYKTYNLSNIAKKPVTESPEKFEAIRQLYSPKKMVVDGKYVGYQTTEEYGIQALWHSFWKSVELKKQYELENNFKYDYVLKLRMDLVLNRHTSFELLQEILTIENNQFKVNQWFGEDPIIFKNIPLSTDVFFISKSKEMDIAADYAWALMKSFSNGEYINLIYYLSQHNIKTSHFSYVERYALLRDDFVDRGVLELDKSEMLDEIDRLENYYYASPEIVNENNFVNDLNIELKKKGIILDMNTKYYVEDIFKLIEESN
jgi:hypothetical protein